MALVFSRFVHRIRYHVNLEVRNHRRLSDRHRRESGGCCDRAVLLFPASRKERKLLSREDGSTEISRSKLLPSHCDKTYRFNSNLRLLREIGSPIDCNPRFPICSVARTRVTVVAAFQRTVPDGRYHLVWGTTGLNPAFRTDFARDLLQMAELTDSRLSSVLLIKFRIILVEGSLMRSFVISAAFAVLAIAATCALAFSGTAKGKSSCGCTECKCLDCSSGVCTCGDCQCGSCACSKSSTAATPVKSCCSTKATKATAALCTCSDCAGDVCTCEVCGCANCTCGSAAKTTNSLAKPNIDQIVFASAVGSACTCQVCGCDNCDGQTCTCDVCACQN